MFRTSPLASALGVNAQVRCDCGRTQFYVGIAYNPETGNNFIRILECTKCGKQMPVTHQADSGLAPSVGLSQPGSQIAHNIRNLGRPT